MLASIIHRFKKLFILLCIIPIVTAGIAFFMEMGKETTYTASTKIELGNFENQKHTSAKVIKDTYPTEEMIKKIIKETNLKYSVEEVKKGLKIEEEGSNTISFKYTSVNKKKAEEITNAITEYFLKVSNELYTSKKEAIDNSLKNLEKLNDLDDSKAIVDREIFLSEQTITKLNLRGNNLLEPVSITTDYNNPLKKAVFGFLVGIMLSLFILLIPELFKEYREERI
ncbi:hypothetical protein [Rossellomorea sp. NRS-1567]|uniref:hypothetical protein n=1 Tax=Rossellomorea sp. NRS-1567 TaxID=3233901 RepID=UPI003D29D6F2